MSTTYFHVTATEWDGSDLQCWNTREAFGIVGAADWKWEDAPVGADGHLVALVTDADDLDGIAYAADIDGGSVLRIDIPAESLTDSADLDWDDADEDRVCLTTIVEGMTTYPAVLARIPARYITRVA